MAKKSINELGLVAQPTAEIGENVPEEFSSAPPPPYPGTYRFKLPTADRLKVMFDTFEREVDGKKVQFVQVIFDKDDPLVITGGPEKVGEPFTTRIGNSPRNRSRKGEPEVLVSDFTYLLRALDLDIAKKVKNYDNKAAIDALVKVGGGKEVIADVEWSTYCNAEKQAYYTDESGNQQAWFEEDGTTEKHGCGERYYMNHWPRGEDGRYLARMTCKCGASLRPFAGLRLFKAAK
jgi:hypothetical protein